MRVHSPASVGASSSPSRALSRVDLPALILPAIASRSGPTSRRRSSCSVAAASGPAVPAALASTASTARDRPSSGGAVAWVPVIVGPTGADADSGQVGRLLLQVGGPRGPLRSRQGLRTFRGGQGADAGPVDAWRPAG